MNFFKTTDIIVIFTIIAVSIAAWMTYGYIASDIKVKAEIYHNSRLVETIDINKGEEKYFSVSQKGNVVFHLDREGNIRFKESDCPDKVCIKTGKLRMAGQSAACLPNGLVMKIVPLKGYKQDDFDLIVW